MTHSLSSLNFLPQLSALADSWINRRLIHDSELRKWKNALNSEPRQEAALSLSDTHRVALIFSDAFMGYGKPRSHSSMLHLGMKDLQKALVLNQAWQRTLNVAKNNNALNLAVQRTNATSIPFLEQVSRSVANNTAQKLIQAFNTSTVVKASHSAELLLDALKAQLHTQHFVDRNVQQERLHVFCELHRLLESSFVLDSGALDMGGNLREKLRESAEVLNSLQRDNDPALSTSSASNIAH